MDVRPPESPEHSHSDSEESSAFADILSSYSPITPANEAFDPESFYVLASPPPNPFTNIHNSQLQEEPVSHHNSVAPTPRGPIYHGQPIFDQGQPPKPADDAAGFDNLLCSSSSSPQIRNTSHDSTTTGFIRGLSSPSSSVDSNHETGEMATGLLPPLSLEQIKEHFDVQRWERLMQQRSDIAPSTFCPQAQVDQNQHRINTFGLQFKDIQHNATTSVSSFHNRPENTFQWCTPYNSQLQEPASLHNSVAPRPIFDQRPPNPADNVAGFEHEDASRQRRGCSCKKSKCLIHCKCYWTTVGCSNLCRCENCENMYGKKAAPQPQQSSVPRHNMAPTPTAPPAFQSSNYAEAAPNSWNEAGPSMAATPYGINHLQQPPAAAYNNIYGVSVNDELMMSGTGFHLQQHDQPVGGTGDPMNPFSQNFNEFGNPNPENWVINTRSDMQYDHHPGVGDPMNFNAFGYPNLASAMPNPENRLNNYNATNAEMLSHIGQNIPTANAQAQVLSHIGQNIPTANAQTFSQIPTTVNPFHTEQENNVFYAAGGVYNILANSSRDAAHQMLEESPAPHPNAAVQVASSGNRRVSRNSLTPIPVVNPITWSSRAAGEMSGGYNYLLQLQDAPSSNRSDGAPVNPITSSSSSGAAGDMSGFNYLLHGDPSSKGFDGGHAKKD